MSLAEHHLQLENEALRRALQSAVDYLRMMPRCPATQAKIAALEKMLAPTVVPKELAETRPWSVERITPTGETLTIRVANGEMRFENQCALPQNSTVPYHLNHAEIDSLIATLLADRPPSFGRLRTQSIGKPHASGLSRR